jgi:tetratricopeptide (TPR) repeat protein
MADSTLLPALERARRILAELERQAAGYTDLTRPAALTIELEDQRQAVADLEQRLQQDVATAPPLPPRGELPPPGSLPPGSRLPFLRNALFTGRQQALLALAERLLYASEPAGMGRLWAAAATGYGGVGKTQLAVEFCYRYGRFFAGVHWLQADQDLAAEIAACGGMMGLPDWPERQPEQVRMTLRLWSESGPRLVVLDNLEDVRQAEEWLPQLACARLLITSRRGGWEADLGLAEQPLETLPRPESLELLRKLAPRLVSAPDADLQAVADRLGDLPLALDLAGRYLLEREELGAAEYIEELRASGSALEHTSLLDWTEHNPTRHETSLAETFLLSWQRLEGAGDEIAMQVFLSCGYCAANTPIPRELLYETFARAEQPGDALDAARPDLRSDRQVDRGLRRLYELGLLKKNDPGPSLHPLLAEFARAQDKSRDHSVLPALAKSLHQVANRALDSRQPARYEPLQAHLQSVATAAEKAGVGEAAILWSRLGHGLRISAQYPRSKVAFERALAADVAVAGEESSQAARDWNNLGEVHRLLGDLDQARRCCEQALHIDEKILGLEHPYVAIACGTLGLVLQDMGLLEEARVAFERALSIQKKAISPENPLLASPGNPLLATITSNLGSVFQSQGQLEAARTAFEQALAMDEGMYGPNHPNIARDVLRLGGVLRQLGDLPGARAACERALAIDENVFGPEHPYIAACLDSLGDVLRDEGDLGAARSAYQRALEIFKKSLPPEHPNISRMEAILLALGDEGQGDTHLMTV